MVIRLLLLVTLALFAVSAQSPAVTRHFEIPPALANSAYLYTVTQPSLLYEHVLVNVFDMVSDPQVSTVISYDLLSPNPSGSVLAQSESSVFGFAALPVGSGNGSNAAVLDSLQFQSNTNPRPSSQIIGVDVVSGSVNWSFNLTNTTARATAALDIGLMLTLFPDNSVISGGAKLSAVNAVTGALTWAHVVDGSSTSPVYYRGVVYYFTKAGVLYTRNASTGTLKQSFFVSTLCNITNATKFRWSLTVQTYDEDVNGNLDAFLMYGNTTTAGSGSQFTVCRFSHNSGQMKWITQLPEDITMYGFSGASGNLFVSGSYNSGATNAAYYTFALNGDTGALLSYPYTRLTSDLSSAPVPFFHSTFSTTCVGSTALIQQFAGMVYCICASDPSITIWKKGSYGCHYDAVPVTPDLFACVSDSSDIVGGNRVTSVVLASLADGGVVWMAPADVSQLPVTDGIAIYAAGGDGTLYAFSVASDASNPNLGNGGTLTAGETAVISIFAVMGAAALIVLVVRYRRRAYRSVPTDIKPSAINEYGGLTDN